MRNPRHPLSHVLPALAAALVLLTACGSDSTTGTTGVDETVDPVSDIDETIDPVSDIDETIDPIDPAHETSEASTQPDSVIDSSTDGQTATTGSGTLAPGSWIEPLNLYDDPSVADRYAADVGVVSATGADVDIWVDDTFHQPPATSFDREIVHGADGDGAGGIVWSTATGLHHLRADGSQTTLLEGFDPETIRLLDVADSSLGTLALLLRTDGGEQFLMGAPLDQADTVAFDIAVSNPGWRTTHAALIGDDSDRILVSGEGGGCLGVAAIDFAGDPVGLPNVPLVSGAIADPAAGSDVCADGTSMIAAWDPAGLVTIATGNGADPVTITVYDTVLAGADDWTATWQPNIGPTEAKFLDVDLAPTGASTALIADEWNGSYRFDPAKLFDPSAVNIVFGPGAPSAMPPLTMALAPGFTGAQANVGGEIDGAVPDPIDEELPDTTGAWCTPTPQPGDVLINPFGEGPDLLWRFLDETGATGGRSATILHGRMLDGECLEVPAEREADGAPVVFESSFSSAAPAGWYCDGVGSFEIVQWVGDAGTGANDASVVLTRHGAPDQGNLWSGIFTDEIAGLSRPFPPDAANSTCPDGMEP